MVEVPRADKELRFRNVSLLSGGKSLHGTLHLTKHHLLFAYHEASERSGTPKIPAKSSLLQHAESQSHPPTSAETSGLTATSADSPHTQPLNKPQDPADSSSVNGSVNGQASVPLDGVESRRNAAKRQPKNIWIPYPVINYCVLRPSHAPAQTVRLRDEDGHVAAEEDELFPPTFGTATYERPSSDSARLAPYSSPSRPMSPATQGVDVATPSESGRQPAIRIRCRDYKMLALHFHASHSGSSPDDAARQAFYVLRSRRCIDRIEDLHAFHFEPPREEALTPANDYDARREYARMGIGAKAADGPGSAWRISDINRDYSYSATYPNVLCVPQTVSDNMLKYGGAFRSKCRIPCLAYLHSNGGSITRSSQPMIGVGGKRNPQDERLVSAIFSSHTSPLHSSDDLPTQMPTLDSPSISTLDSSASDPTAISRDVHRLPTSHSDTDLTEKVGEDSAVPRKKIYGSTRRNLIVDARPRLNALANKAQGGGVEDVANYSRGGDMPVEKVFLNIANIHAMRSSLDKVIDSFANADYIKVKPNGELLRKSDWLTHIVALLDGAEMVAKMVGLGGSHVLVHCSDGWDRTAQVSALAQVMLDPHYRTLQGFISLVQKDFLSFGHKFRDRNGVDGSDKWFEIENERIAPSRTRENNASDPNSLNNFGSKALSGAKSWFEKNRGNLFRQQNNSRDSLDEHSSSRPSSPPPNPILHSPASPASKEDKKQRVSDNEISPVFHQFLDAIYQLHHHYPDVFEFNERFLRRLYFHAYSCQYGEFLFNTERERNQYKGRIPSVWPHFLSRRHEFVNQNYTAKVDDPLLFPKRQGSDRELMVRWWSSLFQRSDNEMNVPRALAPADPPATTATPGASVSFDEQSTALAKNEAISSSNGAIKETKSNTDLSTMSEEMPRRFSAIGLQSSEGEVATAPQHDGRDEVLSKREDPRTPTKEAKEIENAKSQVPVEAVVEEYDGDPLGVTASFPRAK